MAVTSAFATIANSIAALAIPGVSIRDIDEIPQAATAQTPVLIPQPNGFVTNFEPTFKSFGSNGTAAIDLEYDLNYVYLHCELGSGLSQLEMYAGLMRNLTAILVTLLSNDSIAGAVDQKPRVGEIGPIEDPSGNQYWGVMFSLHILEFAQ
jgi:hypothetical protein